MEKMEKINLLCEATPVEGPAEEVSEQSSGPTSQRPTDLIEIQTQLNSIRLRVCQLNRQLGLRISHCPDIDPSLELVLLGSHPKILQLLCNNHKLEQQLTQIFTVLAIIKHTFRMLSYSVNRGLELTRKLKLRCDQLNSFHRCLQKDQVLCLERYRNLDHQKLGDYTGNINVGCYVLDNPQILSERLAKFITVITYKKERERIGQVLQLLIKSSISLLDRTVNISGPGCIPHTQGDKLITNKIVNKICSNYIN